MNKMKPPHPGKILLEDVLKPSKISVEEAANLLSVTFPYLHAVVNEKVPINDRLAYQLYSYFGGEAKFWLRLQKKYDKWEQAQQLPSNDRL